MLDRNEVIAFVATTDAPRALAFYRDTLGLRLVADEPWAIVFDAGGTMLRIQKAPKHTPAPHTALGWKVADLAATMAGLRERGVTFERYPWMQQDAAGVWATPDGTRIAWFKDPDGNVLSLTQF
jgi:catechol 2,3-dioxygenase-like lactoylglutathione lyase family enzyme